jgi:hypothetical protein
MSGLVNVLLLYNTFRVLIPAFKSFTMSRNIEEGMPSMIQGPMASAAAQRSAGTNQSVPRRSKSVSSSMRSLMPSHSNAGSLDDSRSSFASPSRPVSRLSNESITTTESRLVVPPSRSHSLRSFASSTTLRPANVGTHNSKSVGNDENINVRSNPVEHDSLVPPLPRNYSLASAMTYPALASGNVDIASLPLAPEDVDISDWLSQPEPQDVVPPPRGPKRRPTLTTAFQTSSPTLSPVGVPPVSLPTNLLSLAQVPVDHDREHDPKPAKAPPRVGDPF